MTEAGALGEAYRDLIEVDRRREGTRYTATLPDGTPVVALAIASDVGTRISSHDRFAAEFQRAAAVHHEGIVPPVAWGALSDGTLHCAYARFERRDVTPGSLPPVVVAGIGAHLAKALAASHAAGVVHGAISPGRFVLTRDRGALLADFGLFAALSEGGLGVQAASALLNEPGYVGPEVQRGDSPTNQSDIYSLGASLYELLTGKPPYGGRMTSFVLASVLSEDAEGGEPPTEPSGPVTTSNPIVDALMRAIEREPEDRWPSATAFAVALTAGFSTGEIAAITKQRKGCLSTAAVFIAVAGLFTTLAR